MSTKAKNSFTFEDDDYLTLDKLSVPLTQEVTQDDGSFTLCLWIYLVKTSKFGILIRQVCIESREERPFLTIDHSRKLSLHYWSFPLQKTGDEIKNYGSVSTDQSCPVEKWIHIGCEIGNDVIRIHMDGVVLGEKPLHGLAENNHKWRSTITLMGCNHCSSAENVQGYAHYVRVLPQPAVTNHYVKHPPLELSLDGSTGASDDHEVEEGGDGIWSVVGGKASCRRNFALDVVLLDALGRSIHKDMELIALLVYADNGIPVEKPKDDAEAPLLTTFDGVEFPSTERPIKLVHGRASFKLKISQLSSKCDNRLFRVCFDSPNTPSYPFLQVFSRPIRCVSRNRNSRAPAAPSKRPNTAMISVETVRSPEEVLESPHMSNEYTNINGGPPIKCISGQPPIKRARTIPEKVSTLYSDQSNDVCGAPHSFPTCDMAVSPVAEQKKACLGNAFGTGWPGNEQCDIPQGPSSCVMQPDGTVVTYNCMKQEILQEENNILGDSDAPLFKNDATFRLTYGEGLSDFFVFKYCLENMYSRAAFLKGVVMCRSDQELSDFGKRVSHYTSCHHNGYQIFISKKLIQDGNELWKEMAKEAYPVPWSVIIDHIEEHFLRLSNSRKRRFSLKDKSFLRQLTKCGEFTSREEFDRLWYWIYPVSLAVSSPQVRLTWEIEEPKWIQGMVSRKEAEALLSQDRCKPGTFILRFVSTRSWPHPDAGGLIVSYVGQDIRVHHKLLSLDKSTGFSIGEKRPLSELLLSQDELSQPYRPQ